LGDCWITPLREKNQIAGVLSLPAGAARPLNIHILAGVNF
jgi:hypothetical protein